MLTLNIHTTWQEVEALAQDWHTLSKCNQYSAMLSFEWTSAWWKIHGESAAGYMGGLRVLSFWDSGKIVGILPLYLQVREPLRLRTLRFIGTGETGTQAFPEYLDLLCDVKYTSSILELLRPILFSPYSTQSELQYDSLDLGIGAVFSRLNQWAETQPVKSRGILLTKHYRSYEATLKNGFEEYLGNLGKETRQRAKRILREISDTGAVLDLCDSWNEILFSKLIKIHQAHWTAIGKTGAFAEGRPLEFQLLAARSLFDAGLALLAHLHVQGSTEAILYGFKRGTTFEFYQSGRAATNLLSSPGVMAHLLLIKKLSESGFEKYNFLAGDEDYKRQFSTSYQHLVNLRFHRLSLMLPLTLLEKVAARV